MSPDHAKRERPVLRVLDVVRAVRGLLESALPDVWVEGEITDTSESASGHLYFTLNDGGPILRPRGDRPDTGPALGVAG